MEKERKSKKTVWVIILILAIIVFFCAFLMLLKYYFGISKSKIPDVISSDADTDTSTEDDRVDNPVDFDALKAINNDIYAWISIPACEIEYPIIQPTMEDDLYYLRRNIYREYEYSGTIFTEKNNSKLFDDPNTVIYGHNMLNGTMFSNILKYKDKAFFDENEYIYIYTPGMKYTYRIFSAYQYDDRHLLNTFDLNDPQVLKEYFEYAANPKALDANTRDVGLTTENKIVTLSTCTGANWDYRYLVQGVLISNEPTK